MRQYEFKCPACGRIELANTNRLEASCVVDGTPLKRVFSLGGIAFKGPGFYRNDRD